MERKFNTVCESGQIWQIQPLFEAIFFINRRNREIRKGNIENIGSVFHLKESRIDTNKPKKLGGERKKKGGELGTGDRSNLNLNLKVPVLRLPDFCLRVQKSGIMKISSS